MMVFNAHQHPANASLSRCRRDGFLTIECILGLAQDQDPGSCRKVSDVSNNCLVTLPSSLVVAAIAKIWLDPHRQGGQDGAKEQRDESKMK
jgi:hypothetical protein